MVEQGINNKMNELAESLVHEVELLVERANNYCADIMKANEDKFAEDTQVVREVINKLYQDITQRCIKT
jgi:polyhydroxyalkanoate synthesis regulator phasin